MTNADINFFNLTVFNSKPGVVPDVLRLNTVASWAEVISLNRNSLNSNILAFRANDHSLNCIQSRIKGV